MCPSCQGTTTTTTALFNFGIINFGESRYYWGKKKRAAISSQS
jgi:hypothetical protein